MVQARGGGDGQEAARFAAEWRQGVMQEFRAQAEINQQVSRSLTDLTTAVGTLKTAVDDMKTAPAGTRDALGTYGGCIGQVIFAALSAVAVLISVVGILAQHWK